MTHLKRQKSHNIMTNVLLLLLFAFLLVALSEQIKMRPCSDFMDMLRRLISCRIIIIIQFSTAY